MFVNDEFTLFNGTDDEKLTNVNWLDNLCISIEKITNKNDRHSKTETIIHYQYADGIFGKMLIASTCKGICYLGFEDEENQAFEDLKSRFFGANFICKSDDFQESVLAIFREGKITTQPIFLHLKGTDFQLKVWESLLKIPFGKFSTYGKIAHHIRNPKAMRAVGTAIGNNPISFLIPCHRVIRASGEMGGYRWGLSRKKSMMDWERAKINL